MWDRGIASGPVRLKKTETLNLLPVELLLNSEGLPIHVFACRAYDADKSRQIETGHAFLLLPPMPPQANLYPLSHYSSHGQHPPFFMRQVSGQKDLIRKQLLQPPHFPLTQCPFGYFFFPDKEKNPLFNLHSEPQHDNTLM
jgi:hypothetical protein